MATKSKGKAKKAAAPKMVERTAQRRVSESRVGEREQQGWTRVKGAPVLRGGSVLMERTEQVPAEE